MTRLLLILALLALAGGTAGAQDAPPEGGAPKPFRLPERTTFTLDNGLDVTLVPYGTLPKVTVAAVVRAGNVDEQPGQVWLADLTGDLMKEGTASRSAEQIAREAASMGGSVNIGVGMDQTTVSGDVLSEFAPDLVALVADLLRNPSLPASEFDRLKRDRKRELSLWLAEPGNVALARFRDALYGDHPYGRIVPTEEMLDAYTLDDVRGFYRGHFGAARTNLYVVGAFDPKAVEQSVRKAFGGWARGEPSAIRPPAPKSSRRIYLVDQPGAAQSNVLIGLPVADPSHPEFVALEVTNALLGGAFASRITSNIREDKGYTYSPYSVVSSRFRDAYWAQVAAVTTNVTGPAIREIFAEIDRLQQEPPPARELQGIQNYLAGEFVLQNSTRGGILGQLAFLDLHGLDERFLTEYVRRVYAVTPQQVQDVARRYLRDEEMVIVVVGDRSQIHEQLTPFGAFAN